MSTPSANDDAIPQTGNETVTATVTRTITTTDAEGQTTTLYTTIDEKVAKVGGDIDGTNPVAVSNIKHTEEVSTTINVSDLNANLLTAIEKQSNDAAGADSDIMRMLTGMLQAGLQSKGPSDARNVTTTDKKDPMRRARTQNGAAHSTPAQAANNAQQNPTSGTGNSPAAQTNNRSTRS